MSSLITTPNETVVTSYGWSGTPYASRSIETDRGVVTTNDIVNPSFTTGIAGWSGESATLSWNSAEGRLINTVNTTGSIYYGFTAFMPALAGQVKSGLVTVFNTSTIDITFRLALWATNSSNAFIGSKLGETKIIEPGAYAFLSVRGLVLPADAVNYRLYLQTASGAPLPTGTTFEVDGALTVTGDLDLTPDDYFDGDSATVFETETSTPLLVEGYSSSRASRNVFREVIGRDYPDVTLRPAGLRQGSIRFLFDSEEEAARCEDIHRTTNVLTFSDSEVPTINMDYVVNGNITRTLEVVEAGLWSVQVDFQEVAE